MSESSIAIVGSGIVGTTMAYLLTRKGYDVEIFEKGPEYPYPHYPQFRERMLYMYDNPVYQAGPDVQNLTRSGTYPKNPDFERHMMVGGTATLWGAVTLRMTPHDFNTRSRYGYGLDWPLTYDELEPYYSEAEYFLGVSGSNTDNPLAPARSRPYPLPPFELSYDDRLLADRLRTHDLYLHTIPQARTRLPYEQRPGCMNFGTCSFCPIGVRYSPNYHLAQALASGRCRLHANTSVRRIIFDRSGRARALVYQPNGAAVESEHAAKIIIIAAGAIESARLLLLSSRDRHPDGLPARDHVGQHLTFHHLWGGRLHYREALLPGNVGAHTAQCSQFLDPPGRGRHGAVKVEFSSDSEDTVVPDSLDERTGAEVLQGLREMRHWRYLFLHSESAPSPKKYVTLSEKRDRFGDPFGHLHYESSDFDHETYRFARQIYDRFVSASGSDDAHINGVDAYTSSGHHMGTCRMGLDARDSVVDGSGRVHGTPNLFVIGAGNFASSIPVNPTLTIVALAIRTARHILAQGLPTSS
jgi:choline dehydrogenase-like flavoprotein